jgi:multidrug efflux pump subunit AcrA (membrane-fusion protein)
VVAALVAAALLVPYHKTVVAPGVVEFGDLRVVRAECPGFADKIFVRDGDVVPAGTLLVRLRNDEAAAETAEARIELAAQQARARRAYVRGDVAEHQTEQARADGLAKVVRQKESYLATLEIRAPIAGRVTSRRLERSEGEFFDRGAELLRIGDAQHPEIKLAVGQDAEPHFRSAVHQPVRVRVDGRGAIFDALLDRLDDQASTRLPNEALTALAGGPLPVRRADNSEDEHGRYELAEPRFEATVRMAADAGNLADGELARVKFRSPRSVTVLGEMNAAFRRWVRKFGG